MRLSILANLTQASDLLPGFRKWLIFHLYFFVWLKLSFTAFGELVEILCLKFRLSH